MAWPAPLEALWNDMESVRAELLKETEGLSQAQSVWRPREEDWSVGEILHHLTLAEVGTGKLTSKLHSTKWHFSIQNRICSDFGNRW